MDFISTGCWMTAPATLLCASARGLPAVYIYPVPSCTNPLNPRYSRPPTQLLLGLSLYIFSLLYFAFLGTLRVPSLSSFLSCSWFYSLQYLGEKYVLWIQDPCYCTLCFMFNLIFLIFPGFPFFFFLKATTRLRSTFLTYTYFLFYFFYFI